jgi:hypothetical protein
MCASPEAQKRRDLQRKAKEIAMFAGLLGRALQKNAQKRKIRAA